MILMFNNNESYYIFFFDFVIEIKQMFRMHRLSSKLSFKYISNIIFYKSMYLPSLMFYLQLNSRTDRFNDDSGLNLQVFHIFGDQTIMPQGSYFMSIPSPCIFILCLYGMKINRFLETFLILCAFAEASTATSKCNFLYTHFSPAVLSCNICSHVK